jgi:hypothetical protein
LPKTICLEEASMSSRSDRDFIDNAGKDLRHEDQTAFTPIGSGRFLDSWSGFWGGILIAIAGGALVPHAPWLSGLMILAGYGATAWALGGSESRLGRSLRFGFAYSAALGASILAGTILFPQTTWSLIGAAGERHLIFCGLAGLPWALGLAKYIHLLFRPRLWPA